MKIPPPLLPRTLLAIACSAATPLALSGCSVLSRPAADQAQYYLEVPAPAASPTASSVLPQLKVRRASAIAPFDGLGFVYAQSDGTWRTDAYAGWIATPSAMVTSALSDYLARSGRIGLVAADGAIRTDVAELSVVVERLYGDFRDAASGKAIVRLRWYLTSADEAKPRDLVVASGLAESAAPIERDDPGAVAEAFSVALGGAFARILEGVSASAPKPAD